MQKMWYTKLCHSTPLHLVRCRDVIKISSCQVNTTSRWGINQPGISFGSIVLLFSYATSWGATFITPGGNHWPPALNDSLQMPEFLYWHAAQYVWIISALEKLQNKGFCTWNMYNYYILCTPKWLDLLGSFLRALRASWISNI